MGGAGLAALSCDVAPRLAGLKIGRESFLSGGLPGSFDSKFQWIMPSPIIRQELGEIFFYYGGLNRDHAGRVDGEVLRGGVGLARGRLDGLISLDTPRLAAGNGTVVLTRQLQATGGPLRLNIDTGAQGAAWIEICDATPAKVALPGFGMAEAVAVVTNDVDHAVQFANKTGRVLYGAERLAAGRLVQLRLQNPEQRIIDVVTPQKLVVGKIRAALNLRRGALSSSVSAPPLVCGVGRGSGFGTGFSRGGDVFQSGFALSPAFGLSPPSPPPPSRSFSASTAAARSASAASTSSTLAWQLRILEQRKSRISSSFAAPRARSSTIRQPM